MKSSTLFRLAAVVALGSFCVDSTWADATNVLFLFSDDQSPGSLGALGHPDVKTPNIDQLYGEGFHFSQAYCMGSMIPPVCQPSRAMLMSGKSLFRAPRQLDRGALMPEVFRKAGYNTFATGKWHNGRDSWLRGFEEGEAIFFGGAARDHHDVRVERVENGELVPDDARGKHATELFADATIAFLKRQKLSEKPFFCYVPFTAPHTPHVSPQRFQDMYDADKLQLPKNFRVASDAGRSGARARGGRGGRSARGSGRRGGGGGRLGTEADARRSYVQYYAMITHLDHHIGRIIQTLKDTGQYGKTLIVFASDHGYSMGNHGQRGKTSLYEHSTRAMINFSGPGIPAKGSSEALVYLFDLFPTLCDLTGLTVPEDVEGKSLAGIVRGQRQQVRDQILTAYSDTLRALRRQDWKVYKRLREDRVELFNLEKDPLELSDLSQQPEHRKQLETLLAALEEAREGFGETPAVVASFMRSGRGGFGGRGNFGGRGIFSGRGDPGARVDPGGREDPGGRGGPPGGLGQQRDLVVDFDKDGDKRLDVEERAAAREFLKNESAGRRRGGPGRGRFGRPGAGDSEPPKPGRPLTPADVASFPDAGLYDPKVLRTFFLEFENEDWEKELADFKNTDVEVPAKLQVDGRTYENVGVHFRGMTSFMTVGEGRKRSLNLSFDFANKDQRLHGYRTINLLNSHTDPTFLRIALFSRIAREYIPTPKANYARVVINGESWGVYVNVQQFNKDFMRDWFHTSKGARWKTPGSPRGRAGLAYLGDDPDEYKSIYQIRSKDKPESWNELIKLCRILNETPAEKLEEALEPILDLDGALKFLAVDNALINKDGFWTRASDYNLLRDREGRFHLVPHDMNETFLESGGPGGRGGGFSGFGSMGRGQTAQAIMAQADKSGDAKLDRDELTALAALWFEKIDSEKAGKLTKEQFTSGLGAALLSPRGGGESNGRAPRPGDGPSDFIREGLFSSADLDEDGSLTQEELERRLQSWFIEWDDEKTGSIDADTLANGLRVAFPQPRFGGFPGGQRGGRRGGGPATPPKAELDPLIGLNDTAKPLLSKLLAVPALRELYLGYVRDIAENWLDWEKLGPIAREYQALIADDVAADTRKLDSTEAFFKGLEENVEANGVFGRGVKIGLKTFADQRRAYLLEKTSLLVVAEPVKLHSGLITGEVLDPSIGLRAFRGIPYAAPPVGTLRWKPPQDVAPWDSVRECVEFGSVAPQNPGLTSLVGDPLPPTDEDCLFLNIWTTGAGSGRKMPVMVWIHGGGFRVGWSNQSAYEGREYARRGVVLVTINYRVGPLGHFAHPALSAESARGVSGNYGLLDQVFALEWVQKNIAAFGGDPFKVTIFGESAGGASVEALCVSPLAKGLFHRGIAQSPGGASYVPLKDTGSGQQSVEQLGEKYASQFLTDQSGDVLAALRRVPADKLIKGVGFAPKIAIDGWSFADTAHNLFAAGKQHDVPLIVGSNTDEATIFVRRSPFKTVVDYKAGVKREFGDKAVRILELYPASADEDILSAVVQRVTDSIFLVNATKMLRGMSGVSSSAYQYVFSHRSERIPERGAFHSAEMNYVFNTLHPEEEACEDPELAAAMIRYWVQFAKTGDPNVDGLPQWPKYGDNAAYIELGDKIKENTAFRVDAFELLSKP